MQDVREVSAIAAASTLTTVKAEPLTGAKGLTERGPDR
jgi:hypothetical protein